MAARNPLAVFDPLGPQTEPRMTAHDIFCLHTMDGFFDGTNAMFHADGYGGTESHYGLGGAHDGAKDGHLVQWQDRAFQADANLDGNPRVLSVETSDGGRDNEPLSDKQLDTLVELVAWECSLEAHQDCPVGWACREGVLWEGVRVAIPPVLIPDTKTWRRGLGVHRQGCSHGSSYVPGGWPYDAWRNEYGGEAWSEVTGKLCPWNVRIRQFVDIVIPRVQRRLLGLEEDEVELTTVINKESGLTVGQLFRQMDRYIDNSATREVETLDKVAALRQVVLEAVENVRLVAVEARQRAVEARNNAAQATDAAQAARVAADAAATLAEVEDALERMQVVFQVVVPPVAETAAAWTPEPPA